jgi:curved DNA-binding protein CbpA
MSAIPTPAELGSDAPIDVALLAARVHGSAGGVVGRSGKKKWVFVFVDGELVETRSNLKSEHPDTIRAKKPDMSDAAVHRNCAMARLRNAIRAEAKWSWSNDSAPKQASELGGVGLLFRSVAGHRSVEDLRARIDAGDDATVALAGDLGALDLPRKIKSMPSGWSGATVADALASGGGSDAERATALWFGLSLGVMTLEASSEADEGDAGQDAPAPPGLDIASLLDGLGTGDAAAAPADAPAPSETADEGASEADDGGKNWVPDKVLLPPEGTAGPSSASSAPEDYEEAQIEALGGDGPVTLDASFFEALNRRPDRETIRNRGSVHTSSQEEDGAEPEPEAVVEIHPLENDLRDLAEKIEMAPDLFGVLDVPWDSETEAFRQGHLKLAQKLHPDRYSDASDELQDLATETFDKVRAAWEVLGDETARGAYIDKVIHGKKTEDELAMEQVENYFAAEADFKRGHAAFISGRIRQAHELFKSAVEREPNELEFRAYLGFTSYQLFKTSDLEKAEVGKEMLKEVLEKNKEQERKLDAAWVLMGRIFRDEGNDKGARRCFVQALKINASNGDAQREMRRLTGTAPNSKKKADEQKSGGFFSRWFGKK